MLSLFSSSTRQIVALGLTLGAFSIARADHHEEAEEKVMKSAIVVLVEGNSSGVSGTVAFTEVKGGVRVVADVKGLTPGKHGFHIHQKGDLSKADLTSTGGHYNPQGHDHAGPMSKQRHVGDLGNLEADENGVAQLDSVFKGVFMRGKNSILGRGVIIHAGEDDLISQPTGAAGSRVAGGVIGLASE
jgi:Cu-Zn family superoxide dismutase